MLAEFLLGFIVGIYKNEIIEAVKSWWYKK